MDLYLNKLKELEILEEEKERQKEEINNQNQSQIEFGIDADNPFYTEDEGNFPEISFKFTSAQFNQFTYVLFKNFEAKLQKMKMLIIILITRRKIIKKMKIIQII